MTETSNTPSPDPKKCKGRRRGFFFLSFLVLGSALAGGLATKALSHAGPGWHKYHGHHGGFMRTRGGPMALIRGPVDPEKAQKRAARMAKHLAVEVDATPQQTDKLVDIAKALAVDTVPIRKELRSARKQVVDLLTSQDNVDRAAIEQLRAAQIQKFDAMTKLLTTALGDASEVLTSEQRKELSERIADWREWRGKRRWWRRGHGGDKE